MLTKKKEGWVNIFKDFEDTVCCVYPTEKEALEDGETEKITSQLLKSSGRSKLCG